MVRFETIHFIQQCHAKYGKLETTLRKPQNPLQERWIVDSNNCLTILFGRSGTNFDIFCPCHCMLGSPFFVPGVLPNTESSGIPETKI